MKPKLSEINKKLLDFLKKRKRDIIIGTGAAVAFGGLEYLNHKTESKYPKPPTKHERRIPVNSRPRLYYVNELVPERSSNIQKSLNSVVKKKLRRNL